MKKRSAIVLIAVVLLVQVFGIAEAGRKGIHPEGNIFVIRASPFFSGSRVSVEFDHRCWVPRGSSPVPVVFTVHGVNETMRNKIRVQMKANKEGRKDKDRGPLLFHGKRFDLKYGTSGDASYYFAERPPILGRDLPQGAYFMLERLDGKTRNPCGDAPRILNFGRSPEKRYYKIGEQLELLWSVSCPTDCAVSIERTGGKSFASGLPLSGTIPVQGELQDKAYNLVVRGAGSTVRDTTSVRTRPKTNGGTTTISTFYFRVTCPSQVNPCFVTATNAPSEQDARAILESRNANCQLTNINAQDYYSGCR